MTAGERPSPVGVPLISAGLLDDLAGALCAPAGWLRAEAIDRFYRNLLEVDPGSARRLGEAMRCIHQAEEAAWRRPVVVG